MNRRHLITGLISLVAAPAIVRISSIMPVKAVIVQPQIYGAFNAEDAAKFYARLKLYMDEVVPFWERE
jgi:hypothetical protein